MTIDREAKRLRNTIAELCAGLVFVSEIDAPVEPVMFPELQNLTQGNLIKRLDLEKNEPVETANAQVFFDRLTQHKDWHDQVEKENTERFKLLRETLERELDDLHVFRIGRTKIDIYVLGISRKGIIAGVQTTAVET